jgi:hypothetical protein
MARFSTDCQTTSYLYCLFLCFWCYSSLLNSGDRWWAEYALRTSSIKRGLTHVHTHIPSPFLSSPGWFRLSFTNSPRLVQAQLLSRPAGSLAHWILYTGFLLIISNAHHRLPVATDTPLRLLSPYEYHNWPIDKPFSPCPTNHRDIRRTRNMSPLLLVVFVERYIRVSLMYYSSTYLLLVSSHLARLLTLHITAVKEVLIIRPGRLVRTRCIYSRLSAYDIRWWLLSVVIYTLPS